MLALCPAIQAGVRPAGGRSAVRGRSAHQNALNGTSPCLNRGVQPGSSVARQRASRCRHRLWCARPNTERRGRPNGPALAALLTATPYTMPQRAANQPHGPAPTGEITQLPAPAESTAPALAVLGTPAPRLRSSRVPKLERAGVRRFVHSEIRRGAEVGDSEVRRVRKKKVRRKKALSESKRRLRMSRSSFELRNCIRFTNIEYGARFDFVHEFESRKRNFL